MDDDLAPEEASGGELVGLTSADAERRLRLDGFNELPTAGKKSLIRMALEILREPMILLLAVGAALYFVLGDRAEALMLVGSVGVVVAISLLQERKSERAIEALRDLSSPRALVVRDGVQTRISGRELVRGDLMLINEGDRVAGDACILRQLNLAVDESLLTGESGPVNKKAEDAKLDEPKFEADRGVMVFSGSLVVRGQATTRVIHTGLQSEIGKIGSSLATISPSGSRLSRQIAKLVRVLAIEAAIVCTVLVVIYGITRHDWLEGLLAGVALAMSALPEEFPVILTLFLAIGAWRISRRNVLTRHIPAIEALGTITVLCVDKTGTLTQNRMRVRATIEKNHLYEFSTEGPRIETESERSIVQFAALASKPDAFDPMEQAILTAARAAVGELPNPSLLLQEYPLDASLLAVTHVWKEDASEVMRVASKGAPESIALLCGLSEPERIEMMADVERLASRGLRVLAVAKAEFSGSTLPESPGDLGLTYLGLVGLDDPVRESVPESVRLCDQAGIRVIMITGDYPSTASFIARDAGLKRASSVMTGPEITSMSDSELAGRATMTDVFARITPQAKLRLVETLKRNGEIVAMTGDGVNDAPALKAADVGIAMGGRGSDVAREAAELVLTDDNFSSIVEAIRLGRGIYVGIKKAMSYVLAIHIPIVGLSLLPLLFGWPLILLPVHIVFLELIIDPAASIVFEAEPIEDDILNHPPRNAAEPLFSRRALAISLLQGFVVLIVAAIAFDLDFQNTNNAAHARTLGFLVVVFANLGLVFVNRSWEHTVIAILRRRNKALWWVTGSTITVISAVLLLAPLRDLFSLAPLRPVEILLTLVLAAASITWFELLKLTRWMAPSNKV